MKKHLLIFFLATLLAAGLNERNRSVAVVSADFPTSVRTVLSQKDDSGRMETAREANSLFVPPSTNNSASGDQSQQSFRIRHFVTLEFTPAAVRDIPVPAADPVSIIACNGAFHRASDYYVYTLRRIVI